jgi:hypothetical protein
MVFLPLIIKSFSVFFLSKQKSLFNRENEGFLLLIFAVLARQAEAKIEWTFSRSHSLYFGVEMSDVTIGGKCLIFGIS